MVKLEDYFIKGRARIKKCPKKQKTPKGGEGSGPKIKKSTIQILDFLKSGVGGGVQILGISQM